jgi:hypothetical protein
LEDPASLGNHEDIRKEGNLDYAVDLFEPTYATERELLHSKKA